MNAAADCAPTPAVKAPGVTLHSTTYFARFYRGSRAALVAAGLAESAWFPGEPGQYKASGRGVRDGLVVQIRRTGADRFEVIVPFPKDVAKAECERQRVRRMEAERVARCRQWEAETALTKEQYLRAMAAAVESAEDLLVRAAQEHPSGMELDDETIDVLADAFDRIRQAMSGATAHFDPDRRTRTVHAFRAAVMGQVATLSAQVSAAVGLPQGAG